MTGQRSRAALVVHPALRDKRAAVGRLPSARLDEAVGLARAIDLAIAHAEVVWLSRIRPATFIGPDAVSRLAATVLDHGVEVAIFDTALTPVQQRNLEKDLGTKVIDRTGLILEIFGERARTREGQMQVELAHLSYQRSRLVRSWTHLERQRGGFGFLGGPGETQIEIDRRLIGERIARLRQDLEGVKRTRGLHRSARKRVPFPVVALVGYTNAGKSTLFNRLTEAGVDARDQVFATLDPTMRGVGLPSGRRIILSDTVGFISDLPHELVAAFQATLEEVVEADLILHVRDVSHPETEEQREDVLRVLGELGIGEDEPGQMIEVLNKLDRLPEDGAERIRAEASRRGEDRPPAVAISALTGAGVDDLLASVDLALGRRRVTVSATLPHEDGATLAWLYRRGEVVERQETEDGVHVTVRLDPEDVGRFEQRDTAGL